VHFGENHMRTSVATAILVTLITSTNTFAVEPVLDQQLMFYYQVPLGANNPQESKHKYGLRFDQTYHDPSELIEFSRLMNRPAVFDIQSTNKGDYTFKINGLDYSETLLVNRVDTAENVDAPAIDEADLEAGMATEEEAAAEAAEAVIEDGEEGEQTATESEEIAEDEPEKEKSVVQKTMDELPFGVVLGLIGAAVAIGGLAN